MTHKAPWFVVSAILLSLGLMTGCGAEVTDEPQGDDVQVDLDEAQKEATKPAVAGEELSDQMRCNKTCILECGDCSCCL